MDAPANNQILYSVEQIELIRRLRNSGISKDQLVQAFDAFDRLEQELGQIYTIPAALTAQIQCMQSLGLSLAGMALPQMGMANGPENGQIPHQVAAQPHAPVSRKRSFEEVQLLMNGHRALIEEEEEESEELKAFRKLGDAVCCEEIRAFLTLHKVRQQQVAVLSGISQSYVSRYLKGDFHEMSERSRRAIQRWYMKYKDDPAGMVATLNDLAANPPTPKKTFSMDSSPMPQSPMTPTNGGTPGEFINYPRRERFVFRPSHLEVLERFFREDSYPSQEKREDIARICNAAIETPGRELSDRERVSATIITNWFANKRKEMKKIAREEGLDISQVPLRGRGRPRVFPTELLHDSTSNLSADDQEPAFHHHESHDKENLSHDPELANQMQRKQMMPHDHPMQSHDQEAAYQMQRKKMLPHDHPMQSHVQEAANEPQRKQPQHPAQREPESHDLSSANQLDQSGDSTASDMDEQSLSLAVEVAAVNQAILALSGQTPIDVKVEQAGSIKQEKQ